MSPHGLPASGNDNVSCFASMNQRQNYCHFRLLEAFHGDVVLLVLLEKR